MTKTMEDLLVDARAAVEGDVASRSRIVDALLDVRNATDRALMHLKVDVLLTELRLGTEAVLCQPVRRCLDEIDACWQLDPVFVQYDRALESES